jgi:4a-hydroxytetrahydrobiopterin dehydratase
MTDVHQCPRCELRFVSKNELHDHFDREHSPFDDPLKTGRTHVLTEPEIEAALRRLDGWAHEGGVITRTFELPSFRDAIAFVSRVADRAEAADHHPDIDIRYDKVRLALATHSAGGVTAKDMKLAAQIDALTR